MSTTLLVRSYEEKARALLIAAVAAGVLLAAVSLATIKSFSVASIVQAIGLGAVGAGTGFGIFHFERAVRRRFAEQMRTKGFEPYVGEFTAGLSNWPTGGFTLFDEKPWAVERVFHHADAIVRTFQGAMGGSGARYDVAGAVIRVPSREGTRRWRETEGWQALADGEWVIVWQSRYIPPRHAGAFAEQVLGFAKTLRGEHRGAV